MTAGLVAFVRARLEEEYHAADDKHDRMDCNLRLLDFFGDCPCGYPARVRDQVASSLTILDWHSTPHTVVTAVDGRPNCCQCDNPSGPHLGEDWCDACSTDNCTTVRWLATRWAGHENYLKEWAP